MLGELKLWTATGEYVLSVNGGSMTIRKAIEKPFEAKKIDSSTPLWGMIMSHLYNVSDIVEASQRS